MIADQVANEAPPEIQDAEEKKTPPALKLIMSIVIGLILAAGAFFLTRFVVMPAYVKYKLKKEAEKVIEEEKAANEMGIVYVLHDFTVNLANTNGRRFLVAEYAIEAKDDAVIDEVQKREPQIRDEFIKYLREQSDRDGLDIDFQERSKKDLIEIINSRLTQGTIDSLYYLRLILQ